MAAFEMDNTQRDAILDTHAIRERAYFLWQHDGSPEAPGVAEYYWTRALELHLLQLECDELMKQEPPHPRDCPHKPL